MVNTKSDVQQTQIKLYKDYHHEFIILNEHRDSRSKKWLATHHMSHRTQWIPEVKLNPNFCISMDRLMFTSQVITSLSFQFDSHMSHMLLYSFFKVLLLLNLITLIISYHNILLEPQSSVFILTFAGAGIWVLNWDI